MATSGSNLVCDGIDDYVVISDHSSMDIGLNDFAVCAWVKFSNTQKETSAGHPLAGVAGRDYLGGGFNGGGLLIYDTPSTFYFQIRDGVGPAINAFDSTDYQDGNWHWVVGRCDRSSSTGHQLWVDGSQVATADPTSLSASSLVGSTNFVVGASDNSGTKVWDFWGEIAYVHYYVGTLLTDDDIVQLMWFPGTVAIGLKGLWRCLNSGTVIDQSGTGNNGTATGASPGTAGPPVAYRRSIIFEREPIQLNPAEIALPYYDMAAGMPMRHFEPMEVLNY